MSRRASDVAFLRRQLLSEIKDERARLELFGALLESPPAPRRANTAARIHIQRYVRNASAASRQLHRWHRFLCSIPAARSQERAWRGMIRESDAEGISRYLVSYSMQGLKRTFGRLAKLAEFMGHGLGQNG